MEFRQFLTACEHAYTWAAVAVAKTDADSAQILRTAAGICGYWADQLINFAYYRELIELTEIEFESDTIPFLTSFDEISFDADGQPEPHSLLWKLRELSTTPLILKDCLKEIPNRPFTDFDKLKAGLTSALFWTIPDIVVQACNMSMDKCRVSERRYYKLFAELEPDMEPLEPNWYCAVCGATFQELPGDGKCHCGVKQAGFRRYPH